MADIPMQNRAALYTAYAATSPGAGPLLAFQLQLDIRDLLARISVASSVGKAEIVDKPE